MRSEHQVPPEFGRRLRRERDRHGWTLRDMAEKTGVSAATLLRVENGNDTWLSTVAAVTSALGLSIDALVAVSVCATCDGVPPDGFICSECRRGETG